MPSIRRGVSELPHFCHAFGVRNAIISPGSRNAPLILAFASYPGIACHSITDERSAGYYAIGMAQELKQPVVMICTSGTAMINFAPALAEAFYLRLPLIAITADRPAEWIDQNDGQTIRQHGLYRNFIKKSWEVPVETGKEEELWLFRRNINEALTEALSSLQGPVHINVPLREPLYEALPKVNFMEGLIHPVRIQSKPDKDDLSRWRKEWKSFNKRMIICGMAAPDAALEKILNRLASEGEAVVVAENLANVSGSAIINTPDRFVASLNNEELSTIKPDLLITLGGPVVSKKLKKYLRTHKPAKHWHVGNGEAIIDTFMSLSRNISVQPSQFLSVFEGLKTDKSYSEVVLSLAQRSNHRHETSMENIPFSDLAAYKVILGSLPENSRLHLANSTPVRYAQLFPNQPGILYLSNRGTSGIDGCISTAAGAAMVNDQLHIAIVGDLAFIYDSNAFWNNHLPGNLRVIIIDNEGGNIFRLIDTTPVINPFRNFFETPHRVDIMNLCQAFGLRYFKADSVYDISTQLDDFFKPNSTAAVLHIKTSGETSARVFKQYYQLITKSHEQQ